MKKRILSCFAFVLVVCCLVPLWASAISWNGSSAGGGGSGTSATVNGYAIRTLGDNCVGYRFSVVDKTGANKVTKVIDVYRKNEHGNNACDNEYKFSVKYNKKQLIGKQDGGFSTAKSNVNCYPESWMPFVTALPAPDGMGIWQAYNGNLNSILSVLGVGNIDMLKNGDKILVEPIYDVKIEGIYHAVTVSEIAIYGKYLLGAYSNGGASYTAESWGFIAKYVNMHYPNSLFTPDGMSLWGNAVALTKQATFYTIINTGYGVGIAYTEKRPDFEPSLTVESCQAWPGSKGVRNNNSYGTSRGNSFATWTYEHDYPQKGKTIWYRIYFPAEKENCYVKQTVSVVGGGSTSRNVYSNSNTIYDVALSPTTVGDVSYYTVKARVDLLDSSGKVKKYGVEKSFYIPVRPIVYRYKVTAYDITGNVAAYASLDGSSGVVYAGQRIQTKYTYTSPNTWTSYNNLWAAMQKWNGSEWVSVNGADGKLLNAALNNNTSKTVTSSIGYTTVPDNSGGGWNHIPVKLTTTWVADTAHTSESNWLDLPIVKPDLELKEIRLITADGYIADPEALNIGEHLTIQYVYKNNTGCKVYADGFGDDESKINTSGVYAIEAGGSIVVNGSQIIVPEVREFNVWGGVYLEGAGIRNTQYESNRNNNEKTLVCKVNYPLSLEPIEPNAPYREKTDVITSYHLINPSSKNYTPADNVSVKFEVYKANGTLIQRFEKVKCVVPKNKTNLVYFKWRVPEGLNGSKVTIKAYIVSDGRQYNLVTKDYNTIPYKLFNTPDTQYEREAPSGFTVPAEPTSTNSFATWNEYVYENGAFAQKQYGVALHRSGNDAEIVPTISDTAVLADGKWTMKSGYGISADLKTSILYVSGYEHPALNVAYTNPQYAYALVPEYSYQNATGKSITLISASTNNWVFPSISSILNIHYTPVWYPDGKYTVNFIVSDVWTPSGMISAQAVPESITINEDMYSDWYVGRK